MPRDKELDYGEKSIVPEIAKEINQSKSVIGNYLKKSQ